MAICTTPAPAPPPAIDRCFAERPPPRDGASEDEIAFARLSRIFASCCSGSSLEAVEPQQPIAFHRLSRSRRRDLGRSPDRELTAKRGRPRRSPTRVAALVAAEIALETCSSRHVHQAELTAPPTSPRSATSSRASASRNLRCVSPTTQCRTFGEAMVPACIPLLIALIHEDLAAAAPGLGPLPSSLLLAARCCTRRCGDFAGVADCDGVEAYLKPGAPRGGGARVEPGADGARALGGRAAHSRRAMRAGVLAHRLDGDGDAADREVVLSILTVVAEEVTSPSSRISAAPASVSGLKQAMRADGGALLRRVHSWVRRRDRRAAARRRWPRVLPRVVRRRDDLGMRRGAARRGVVARRARRAHARRRGARAARRRSAVHAAAAPGGGADAADAADGGGGGGAAAAADGSPSRGRAPQAPRRTVLDAARGACLLPALEPLLPALLALPPTAARHAALVVGHACAPLLDGPASRSLAAPTRSARAALPTR